MTREQIARLVRTPLVKWTTRILLYGLGPLWAKLGVDAANLEGPAAAMGEGIGTALAWAVAAAIDLIHHRKDRAEPPPAK